MILVPWVIAHTLLIWILVKLNWLYLIQQMLAADIYKAFQEADQGNGNEKLFETGRR